MATSYDLGAVSTYALAVQYGFVGTIADWVQAIVSASETYDSLVQQIEALELNIPLLDSTLSYNDRAANAYSVGEYLRRLETLISTPLASSTIAGMTDTTKVYVYTGSETGYTSGNWYYYNGTAWVSGGVYNAEAITTDTTLTIAGSAADAKKVGDELTDIKEDLLYISNKDKSVKSLSTWSNKRVTSDGSLTYSPSQLTTDNILYVGKGNILKFLCDISNGRSLSVSYYQKTTLGTYTYIQNDITTIPSIKYVCAKYDYCRISLVGTSSNPPTTSEFDVEILQTITNEYMGKNIAFLGDSITTFNGVSENGYNTPYYPTGDVQKLEQTYEKMFFDACGGSNISVSAISNSSWRNQGQASCPSAYETTRITRLSVNGTPDYVIINMGTNDPYSSNIGSDIDYTYDVSTLEANVVYSSYAIQTTIRKIQVAYPNAKIIVLIPKFPSAIGTGNYTFEKWEKLVSFIIQIANMYGVYKIVDLRKCGISVETFSTDCIASGMHPNFSGMKKMGAYVIKELLQA